MKKLEELGMEYPTNWDEFNAVMDRTLRMLAPDPDAGTETDVGDTVESRRA